jgi:phosphopantothenoylcysteine decarboxylase/phosphopantothenate--cysteine ligase
MMLEGKKIILAVSGSIAAYKTPELVRQLIKAGAEVRVIATASALSFVSELTLATVSGHAVYSEVADGSSWNNHVHLGRWGDVMVVAPCSANTLAKLAHGLCDNLLCAVYLSAACPVVVAPAMDEDMWKHPSTRANLASLEGYGNKVIPVGYGALASGLTGEGRMAEPNEIVAFLASMLAARELNLPLLGKRAVVTAGPTYEPIDPVRFIGNFSTGKMGFALAEALAELGAEVNLITGPTHLETIAKNVNVTRVQTAEEMYDATLAVFGKCYITIMAAAVGDYRPDRQERYKIKKKDGPLTLQLVKNPDILAKLGGLKKWHQILVGFALETDHELEHAQAKLVRKHADYIILNSLRDPGAGFGHDTNKVTILSANNEPVELPLLPKSEIAYAIVKHILDSNKATVPA